ncbi:MAG: hypothetical protein IJL83_06035 [Clostridia bacterium]|nr:hypothetical protein [Clostridia bacterium]
MEIGDSGWIEFQYCRMRAGSSLRRITSIRKIDFRKDDSLYVSDDDLDLFFTDYSSIFIDGAYSSRKRGAVDLFGIINYYSPDQIDAIIERITVSNPVEGEVLTAWLRKAKETNGFYILGI